MSGTSIDHELVRDYLRALDAALRGLPATQARELKDQITTHLDDALPPDPDDDEVAATLSRLGSPADLAAEARAASAAPAVTRPTSTSGRFHALLAGVRPRTWIAACLVVIIVVAGARCADIYRSAAPLQYSKGGGWWYPQDVKHQQIVVTNTSTQNTTRIRSGQRQGYVISVYNPTNVTQTVLGDASGPVGWDNPGSGTEQISISHSYIDIANGFTGRSAIGKITFSLPVSIPPLQSRLVRVMWTSDLCLSPDGSWGINQLNLRVRIGWFTKTEVIPQQGWYLTGPSHSRCV
jgi:hypothetical protein